jgi:hypothetical protein
MSKLQRDYIAEKLGDDYMVKNDELPPFSMDDLYLRFYNDDDSEVRPATDGETCDGRPWPSFLR